MKDTLIRVFHDSYGHEPAFITRAPGRVNLIGEHTDYNDGFVLPCAISKQTMVAVRPRDDGRVNVVAGNLDMARAQFRMDEPVRACTDAPWSNYVRGMIALMIAQGYDVPGADIAIWGNVPQGAGLSSSASLENATGLAWAALAGKSDIDLTQLALLGQRTEHEFAGCKCGIMDQLVSARAQDGNALLIDCRSLKTQAIEVPDNLAILIVHSGISRGLVDGAYNERRMQCETAAAHYGVAALRDIDVMPPLGSLDPVAYKRARHVVTENARTLAAAKAFASNDVSMLGVLMAASHASMRDDFDITLPAIDALVSILSNAIGSHGGARMTGGGFGGAVVALVAKDRLDDAIEAVNAHYRTPNGGVPDILIEHAGAGVSLIKL
jgi:galactokinase